MKFKTKRKANVPTLLVIISLNGISFIGLVISIILLIKSDDPAFYILIIGSIFFLFVGFILWLQSYAWYTGYSIKDDILFLRGVYKKAEIPIQNIKTLKLLDNKEVQDILNAHLIKANKCSSAGDFKGWYINNKKYSNVLQYSTIQVVQNFNGNDNVLKENYNGVTVGSDLVYLLLNNETEYLLSPKNSSEFISYIESIKI